MGVLCCGKKTHARGKCGACYAIWLRRNNPELRERLRCKAIGYNLGHRQHHRDKGREYYYAHREERKLLRRLDYLSRRTEESLRAKEKYKNGGRQRSWEISKLRKKTRALVEFVVNRNRLEYGVLTCYLCGKKIGDGSYHIEHDIPVSRGGKADIENLDVAHCYCNRDKGRLTAKEYWIRNYIDRR